MRNPSATTRPLLALLVAGAAACASTPGGKGSAELPQWPLPPDKPRIKFVRSFGSEDQMKKGVMRSALRVFVPASPDAVVAQPTGLALSPDERYLYIACSSTSRVLRADLVNGKLEVVANEGGKSAESPFSVSVDGAGNLFISDMSTNAVFVYGADGKFVRRIQSDKLERPTGTAVDRRRQLLYVVSGVTQQSQSHRVEVFSLAGQHLRTIGTRGPGAGEFNFPTNLAVAADGSLYVVDMLNFRIQVFDPEGQLLSMFGTIGAGQPGTFDKAKSVAFDAFGNVYVVDSQQAYVQMFNPKHEVLMAFGGRVNLPGYMMTPTAIAITSKNTIYVADFFAGRVNEYQLVNTTAADSFDAAGGGAPAAGEGAPPATPAGGGTPGSEKSQGG